MTDQPIDSLSDNEQTESPSELEQIEVPAIEPVDLPLFEVVEELPSPEIKAEAAELPTDQHAGKVKQAPLDHSAPLPELPPPHKKNGRILAIAAGCLVVLLACCCSTTLFMYFIGGDMLLRLLGYLP